MVQNAYLLQIRNQLNSKSTNFFHKRQIIFVYKAYFLKQIYLLIFLLILRKTLKNPKKNLFSLNLATCYLK